MRYLIYSESDEAKEIAEALNTEGHMASLRTNNKDLFDEKRPEPCDEVICWDAFIVHAYSEALPDVNVDYRGNTVDDNSFMEGKVEPAPKLKRGRKTK